MHIWARACMCVACMWTCVWYVYGCVLTYVCMWTHMWMCVMCMWTCVFPCPGSSHSGQPEGGRCVLRAWLGLLGTPTHGGFCQQNQQLQTGQRPPAERCFLCGTPFPLSLTPKLSCPGGMWLVAQLGSKGSRPLQTGSAAPAASPLALPAALLPPTWQQAEQPQQSRPGLLSACLRPLPPRATWSLRDSHCVTAQHPQSVAEGQAVLRDSLLPCRCDRETGLPAPAGHPGHRGRLASGHGQLE